jgi:hypothetical protein
MITAGEAPSNSTPDPEDLQSRQAVLHREMVRSLEWTAAQENHWLIYTLVGWEQLVACGISHYLLEVLGLQRPYRKPYLVVWLAWVAVAWATVHLIRPRRPEKQSPLAAQIKRTWLMYFLLCGNVVGLNVAAGLPVFVFLPLLATLGSFAFSIMAALVSPRFRPAGLLMFVTSILIAQFPAHGFLIFGVSWLVVLQTLGVVLWRNKRRLSALSKAEGVVGRTGSPLQATSHACR